MAELLSKLNYFLESDAKDADENNPRGYYESNSIIDLNTSILSELGGTRAYPPRCAEGWERRRSLARLQDAAKVIVVSYSTYQRWAIKDTRLSITLPLWRTVLPADTRYILCIRNPLASIRSWARMSSEPLDPKHAYRTWESFTAFAVKNTAGTERLAVFQEDFTRNPEEQYRRISSFLGSEGDLSKLSPFSRDLVHQRLQDSDFFADPTATQSSKELYGGLLREGRTSSGLDAIGLRLSDFEGFRPPFSVRFRLNSLKFARTLLRR